MVLTYEEKDKSAKKKSVQPVCGASERLLVLLIQDNRAPETIPTVFGLVISDTRSLIFCYPWMWP